MKTERKRSVTVTNQKIPSLLRPHRLERWSVAVVAVVLGSGVLAFAQAPNGRSMCATALACVLSSMTIALTCGIRERDHPHRGAIVGPIGFLVGTAIGLSVFAPLEAGSGSRLHEPGTATLVTWLVAMPLIVSLLGLMRPSRVPGVRSGAVAAWLVLVGALTIWCAPPSFGVGCAQWLGGVTVLAGAVLGVFVLVRESRQKRWLQAVAEGNIAGLRVRISESGEKLLEHDVGATYRIAPHWETLMPWPVAPDGVLTILANHVTMALLTLVATAVLLLFIGVPFLFLASC